MSVRLRTDTAAAREKIRSGGEAGLRAAGEHLLNESRARVPVDSARLRESGDVQAQGLQAQVSYAAPYAAVVHERQVKYLENPMNAPDVREEMLHSLARALHF